MRHKISDALRCLAVAVQHRLLFRALNVVKVEQVGMQNDLGAVIE